MKGEGGGSKAPTATDLANADVVLTTYKVVSNETTASGVLQGIHWRRIALDEMQELRSSTTAVAKMCEALSADARWMVSGTPLYTSGSIDDLNGELNFLGVIPFCCPDTQVLWLGS